VLVDTALYAYDDNHEFLEDVPLAARVAVSGNLTGITIGEDGSFDTDDPMFTSVTGASIEAIILYVHTGDESTARLIMHQDTGVDGLPFMPDGSDVQITVDDVGWFVL
jgi:hypothetical protein